MGEYIFKKLIYTGTIVCSQPTPAINFSRFPSVTAYVLRAPELTTYRCPVRTTTELLIFSVFFQEQFKFIVGHLWEFLIL